MAKIIKSKTHKSNSIPVLYGEIWRNIPGYEGHYMVSNLGRVKSLARSVKTNYTDRCNYSHRKTNALILRPGLRGKKGKEYFFVSLTTAPWTGKHESVHRLVGLAWLVNPKNKPTINHKDGNKLNNCVANLEWATQSENMRHAHRTGLSKNKVGSQHYKTNLTEKEVLKIRERLSEGMSRKEIIQKHGINKNILFQIEHRKTWRHI